MPTGACCTKLSSKLSQYNETIRLAKQGVDWDTIHDYVTDDGCPQADRSQTPVSNATPRTLDREDSGTQDDRHEGSPASDNHDDRLETADFFDCPETPHCPTPRESPAIGSGTLLHCAIGRHLGTGSRGCPVPIRLDGYPERLP